MITFRRDQTRCLFVLAALFWLAFGFVPAPLAAQGINATVTVAVKDESGAVVQGSTVTITDNATKRSVTATTNDEGDVVFAEVRPGSYTVTAEQQGFRKAEVQEVKVNVGVPAAVNIVLTAGGVQEVVTTTASESQSAVNTENAELSTTVLQQQINDLPLNGRNPLELAALQPGVAPGAGNRTATVNGLRGTFSNITWDGININDNFIRTDSLYGAAGQSVPGVAEFTLTSQNAGPGEGLGVAQIKLVTPRGTSEYHGQLYEYHRNDALDANTFFNNADGLPKPQLIRNQFGGAVGGPFQLPRFGEGGPALFGKNKLFFYGYYEGTIERTGIELNRTVLTPTGRQGLFTYRRQDNGELETINLLGLSGLNADPLAQSLVGLTPLPNDLTGGDRLNFARYNFNSPGGSDSHLYGGRVDYDLSERHRFEAIFSFFNYKLPNDPYGDIGEPFPGLPGGGQSSKRPRLSVAWNWTPGPTWNNELRLGFFRTNPTFTNNAVNSRGYQVTFPIISDPEQNFLPQGRRVANYEIHNNASKVAGDHFLRFGGNYRLFFVDPFNEGGVIPQYTVGFNDIGTINPLNDVVFPGGIGEEDFANASDVLAILSGSVNTIAQTFNVANNTSGYVPGRGENLRFRNFNAAAYAGDTWRVRRNLTLNLGLRYEFISVPVERSGLTLLPRGGLEALRDPNAVIDFASGGNRPLWNNDWNNFAPNVSFAWDVFGDGKTSVRGGYGISYVIDNNVTTVLNAAVRGNDGLSTIITLNDVAGTIGAGSPNAVPVPPFQVPVTARQNFENSFNSALFTIDPNLSTPYVQQWNLGVERELFKDVVFEARYVGNRGTKLTRAIDINQQRIFAGGFYEDFLRAQANLNNCGDVDPAAGQCADRQALQVLPNFGPFAFFSLNPFRQGAPGALLDFYIQNKEFFFPEYGGPGSIPLSTFLQNPNTYVADYVGNSSFSTYHALQTEVRKRLSDGFDFQVNYTWSKNLTDYEGEQSNFEALQDLTLGNILEKRRGRNDLTHVFKTNVGYELPFGSGKRFFGDGAMSKILGGFKLTGIVVGASGRPVSIVSQRGTLNRAGRSTRNTVDTTLTIDQLQDKTGLFFDPNTGRPLLFDPSLIEQATGRANPQFFQNPQPGRAGSLQLTPVSGPGYWNVDFGIIKRTPISERANIEFRAEAFNVFNHTNFFLPIDPDTGTATYMVIQNINNPAFGQITETFDPRILQFAIKLNF